MSGLAAILGRFVGAILAECADELVEIGVEVMKRALSDTVEESNVPPDRRNRLRDKLRKLRMGHKNRDSTAGGSGAVSGAGEGEG